MEGITKLSKSWSQYELQIPSRYLNLEHFGIHLRKLGSKHIQSTE